MMVVTQLRKVTQALCVKKAKHSVLGTHRGYIYIKNIYLPAYQLMRSIF